MQPTRGSSRAISSRLEIVEHLFQLYRSQQRWADAQDMLAQKMAIKERISARDAYFFGDVIALAKLMQTKGDLVEAHLHGHRALRGYKKLGKTDEVKTCLALLIDVCGNDGCEDDREAYTTMLMAMETPSAASNVVTTSEKSTTEGSQRSQQVLSGADIPSSANRDVSSLRSGEQMEQRTTPAIQRGITSEERLPSQIPSKDAVVEQDGTFQPNGTPRAMDEISSKPAVRESTSERKSSNSVPFFEYEEEHAAKAAAMNNALDSISSAVNNGCEMAPLQSDETKTHANTALAPSDHSEGQTLGLPIWSAFMTKDASPEVQEDSSSTAPTTTAGAGMTRPHLDAANLAVASGQGSVSHTGTPTLSSSVLSIPSTTETERGTSDTAPISVATGGSSSLVSPQETPGIESASNLADTLRNVTLVGDGAAGKTSLMLYFVMGSTDGALNYLSFNHWRKPITIEGKTVDLLLCDTPGQEDYDRIRPLSYPEAHVFLICFSIGNHDSLDNVEEKWIHEVRHFRPRAPLLLTGCELESRRGSTSTRRTTNYDGSPIPAVTWAEGEAMRRKIGAQKYLECSAADGDGVVEVFEEAARIALMQPLHVPQKKSRMWRLSGRSRELSNTSVYLWLLSLGQIPVGLLVIENFHFT